MTDPDQNTSIHHVLYVDDEENLLKLTELYFNQKGNYAIDTAGSAEEGFKKIEECRYDAIISDFEMPEMNGIEFLSTLRSTGDDTPFIIITGKGGEEVVIDALNAGADNYLQKGGHQKADFVELVNTIEKAIESRRIKNEIRLKNIQIETANRELTKKSEELSRNLDELTVSRNQLQESERRARSLLDSSISTIVLLDRNGTVLDSNDGYPARFGKTRADILGTNVWDLFPKEIAQKRAIWMEQVFSTGKPIKKELTWEGTWDYSIDPVFDADNSVKSITIHATDITRRRQMEEKIRTSEILYRTVVEDQTEFVCRFLPDGTHIFMNDAYCRCFGKTRQELMRAKFRLEIPKEDLIHIREILQTLTPQHPVATIVNRVLLPDGATRWQQWTERAIFDIHGEVTEYQSVGRDITEIKHAEHAILEANNKLNLLSSITRHDILNQLTSLLMLEELLKEEIIEEEPSTYIDATIDITNRIVEQIQFTSDYRELGQNMPAWHNLQKTAHKAFLQSLGWNISADINVENVCVYADLMFEKVFQNLYDNAIRHGKTVTQIQVTFRKENSTGIITVVDNGVGVPEEMKSKIFNRHTGSNTGLGLFLVTEILAITGMKIQETGIHEKGCCFEIIIPEGRWKYEKNITSDPSSYHS